MDSQHECSAEARRRQRAEYFSRSAPSLIADYLGFADLMAFMMVLATAFSGYATWRTASIADQLLQSSERPYFGVQGVALDRNGSGSPRIYIDYRNFGHVPADNVRIRADLFVDQKPQAIATITKDAGIVSPDVTHHVYIPIPSERWREIENSGVSLEIQVKAQYTGAVASGLCYRERFAYASDIGSFEIVGGSSQCDSESVIEHP